MPFLYIEHPDGTVTEEYESNDHTEPLAISDKEDEDEDKSSDGFNPIGPNMPILDEPQDDDEDHNDVGEFPEESEAGKDSIFYEI